MTTLENLTVTEQHTDHLRPFDAYRDLEAVANLVELCFADSLDPDGKNFIQRMRILARNRGVLKWTNLNADWAEMPFSGFVWDEDDFLAGNISLIPFHDKGKRGFLIANVAVHPDFRRKGVARALTLKSIEHARKKGAPGVWLHVREGNLQAEDLYKSLGFGERARRKTWLSQTKPDRQKINFKGELRRISNHHWKTVQNWIALNYPSELTWHLKLDHFSLRHGLWGSLYRLLNSANVQQWGSFDDSHLNAALIWQASSTYADTLWLAAPEKVDDQYVQALLTHIGIQSSRTRPLRLDYPSGQAEKGIRAAGFVDQQTLIWMYLPITS